MNLKAKVLVLKYKHKNLNYTNKESCGFCDEFSVSRVLYKVNLVHLTFLSDFFLLCLNIYRRVIERRRGLGERVISFCCNVLVQFLSSDGSKRRRRRSLIFLFPFLRPKNESSKFKFFTRFNSQ